MKLANIIPKLITKVGLHVNKPLAVYTTIWNVNKFCHLPKLRSIYPVKCLTTSTAINYQSPSHFLFFKYSSKYENGLISNTGSIVSKIMSTVYQVTVFRAMFEVAHWRPRMRLIYWLADYIHHVVSSLITVRTDRSIHVVHVDYFINELALFYS